MIIDKINRKVIIEKSKFSRSSEVVEIKEFDKVHFNFLPNTEDVFETELVLIDVEIYNDKHEPTGEFETKAFARRIGTEIILDFIPENFGY